MTIRDMKQAVKLLSKEWNLGKKEAGADNDICAWIYLLDVLQESEKIITYKLENKLIGFCGYSKENSNKHMVSKKIGSKYFTGELKFNKALKNKG